MGRRERLLQGMRRVEHEALRGLGHRELGRHLIAELGRHIGFDAACVATLDPATVMWTSCEVSGTQRDLAFEAKLFDVEYRHEDVAKLSDIARRALPIAVLSVETGGDLKRSERFRSVHAPAGHGDEIFAKANVTSRQALVAALFFGYWAPEHERGAPPSPWGHYLGSNGGKAG